MAQQTRDYDSTAARIAGNILSGTNWHEFGPGIRRQELVEQAVATAHDIVDECRKLATYRQAKAQEPQK